MEARHGKGKREFLLLDIDFFLSFLFFTPYPLPNPPRNSLPKPQIKTPQSKHRRRHRCIEFCFVLFRVSYFIYISFWEMDLMIDVFFFGELWVGEWGD